MGKSKAKRHKRSARFQVDAPAAIWTAGSDRSSGIRTHTGNISKTGLYLYGDFSKPPGSAFEFEVQLPSPIGGAGGVFRGQGKLVRKDVQGKSVIGFAAEIFKYDFQPHVKPKSSKTK